MKINGCIELSHKYAKKGLAIPLFVVEETYKQGKVDALTEIESMLKRMWERYESDKSNTPKPHFTDAIAIITLVELDIEGEKYDN